MGDDRSTEVPKVTSRMKVVILAGGLGTRLSEETAVRPKPVVKVGGKPLPEPWRVTLVDTGEKTLTGGRLRRVRDYLGDQPFCFTYGDGVGDINVTELIAFHRENGALVTVTATKPPGRFGSLFLAKNEHRIASFREKPDGDGGWINGGFFVVDPKAIDLIDGDNTTWEREPLERLARAGKLAACRHSGFWQPVDTLRGKDSLEGLWATGKAPWKVWD
jgi:glucose-1-phosphate cytidylyltransferase